MCLGDAGDVQIHYFFLLKFHVKVTLQSWKHFCGILPKKIFPSNHLKVEVLDVTMTGSCKNSMDSTPALVQGGPGGDPKNLIAEPRD